MSTPPLPTTDCGLERHVIKTRIEDAILAYLNPGDDPAGWRVSRFHWDDFMLDTDQQNPLSFVLATGATNFENDRQHAGGRNKRGAYASTEIRVKLATRNRAANVRADTTAHLAWADAVLRGAMTVATTGDMTIIWRSSTSSVSLVGGQVLVSEHSLDVRHLLPLQ